MLDADISFINIGSLVLTEGVLPLLKDTASAYGQLLAMRSLNKNLWLWNVTNILDALDSEKSRFNNYNGVIDPVFSAEKIGGSIIFKIKEDNYTNIYCTDFFMNMIEVNDFSGVGFEEFMVE